MQNSVNSPFSLRQAVIGHHPIKLTATQDAAHSVLMRWRLAGKIAVLGTCAMGLVGCVTVEAPDEPIVIELNINIKQEVVYRLADDATDTIEENADIF